MEKQKKTSKITFRLEDVYKQLLDEEAKENNKNLSKLLREIIKDYYGG